jgi:toluene monooxygenase system protein D
MSTVEAETKGLVGPIMQDGEMADIVLEAIRIDNPGADVHVADETSYIRIHTPGRCRLTRATLAEVLGRPCELTELEPHMAFFSGHIRTTSEETVWELRRSGSAGQGEQ